MTVDSASSAQALVILGPDILAEFARANWLIYGVLIALLCCAVAVWTIAVKKVMLFRRLNRCDDNFENDFWSGGSLDDLVGVHFGSPVASVFNTAMREWTRTGDGKKLRNVESRIERVITITINREIEGMGKHLLVLSTVGSFAGSFIGLFGAIWGIVTTLELSAVERSTQELGSVSAGAAVALFAAAVGLAAAIPARVFHDKFSADVIRESNRLRAFGAEFLGILTRTIDEIPSGQDKGSR
jgi:biopolymer transport protein TolQ